MQLAAAEKVDGEKAEKKGKGKGKGKNKGKNKGRGRGKGSGRGRGKGAGEPADAEVEEMETKKDKKRKGSSDQKKADTEVKKPKTVEPEKIKPVEKKKSQRKRPPAEEVEEVEQPVVEVPKPKQRQPKKQKQVEPSGQSSPVNPKSEDGSAARVWEDIKLKVGELRNDAERWSSFNALYDSMIAEQPSRQNELVPKYKHYGLSMYWTTARVGLLQGKNHVLSFASAGTKRIGLPLCATKLYVACWRGSPFWTLAAFVFLNGKSVVLEYILDPQPQSDFWDFLQPMIQLRWSKRVVMSMILLTWVLALLNAVHIWLKWSICAVSWSGWRFHRKMLHLRMIWETSGQDSFAASILTSVCEQRLS